jgi:hypothetical protein
MITAITSKVAGLFFGNGIKAGIIAAVLVALFTWDYSRIQGHKREAKNELVNKSNKSVKRRHARAQKAQGNVSSVSDIQLDERLRLWIRSDD